MKKSMCIFLTLLVSLLPINVVEAQEHLKFMSIPLTGSIDNFQSKLAAKKVYPNKEYNRTTPFGQRQFNGRFAGRDCMINVFYSDDKTVYGATVGCFERDWQVHDNYYNEVKDLLESKYPDAKEENSSRNELPNIKFAILRKNNDIPMGFIELARSKITKNYDTVYYTIITYTDMLGGFGDYMDKYGDL